jgi:hypothetical protein
MTIYCPQCESDKSTPKTEPRVIDEEIDQLLFKQMLKCDICTCEWSITWWEIWTPAGIIKTAAIATDIFTNGVL